MANQRGLTLPSGLPPPCFVLACPGLVCLALLGLAALSFRLASSCLLGLGRLVFCPVRLGCLVLVCFRLFGGWSCCLVLACVLSPPPRASGPRGVGSSPPPGGLAWRLVGLGPLAWSWSGLVRVVASRSQPSFFLVSFFNRMYPRVATSAAPAAPSATRGAKSAPSFWGCGESFFVKRTVGGQTYPSAGSVCGRGPPNRGQGCPSWQPRLPKKCVCVCVRVGIFL